WTKCCAKINANKVQIDRITKSVKAWTVGYGTVCYLSKKNEINVRQGRSLETTWCYEEVYGHGLNLVSLRDFMLENKKLPADKMCAQRFKAPIRYANSTMFAHCFNMPVDIRQMKTVCCCSAITNKPCNFIAEHNHIERMRIKYTKKKEKNRPHCLLLNGHRESCFTDFKGRIACYYTVDLKRGKVDGGCVLPTAGKKIRNKFADVSIISLNFDH
ncbi:unnamed protein product, partial [Thelazia callipaeda]|uniref:Glycoprotein n=1 Tax=Thelazia callipaeda TaxID=103827 RepID=A0A0N5CRV0_THECL